MPMARKLPLLFILRFPQRAFLFVFEFIASNLFIKLNSKPITFGLILLFSCAFGNISIGQTDKQHFILHFQDDKENADVYVHALQEFGSLDQYRFKDTRRTIHFQKRNVSVELYSADELKTLYGKRISPFTILDKSKATAVEFELSPQGLIKVQLLK